jgi:uncharacterized caspase-like protein
MITGLLLALSMSALATEPTRTHPLADLKTGLAAVSDDGRFLVLDYQDAVTVWDTDLARPIARIEVPPIPKNTAFTGSQATFSHDNRLLLIAQSYAPQDRLPWSVHQTISLADLSREKIIRTISRTTHPCSTLLDKTEMFPYSYCGGDSLSSSYDQIVVSPDDKRIAFQRGRTQADRVGYYERLLSIGDMNGKLLSEESLGRYANADHHSAKDMMTFLPVDGPDARLGTYDSSGRLIGIVADESTCQSVDLAAGRKRVSFLDRCSRDVFPKTSSDGRLGIHYDALKRELMVWSLADGALKVDKTFDPLPAGTTAQAGFSSNGRYFFIRETIADKPGLGVGVYLAETGARAMLLPDEQFATASTIDVLNPKRLFVVFDNGDDRYSRRLYAVDGASAETASKMEPAAAKFDVDAVPASMSPVDPDAFAVVIGVEKYRQDGIPAVDFAARDAQTMYAYLTGAMGYDPKNVVLLTDEHATRTDLEKNLKWLSNRVTAKSRVFVYYAGHGSPNPETGEGYLMPYEADPSYLDETAFPIAKLYASLGKLPTKDVTVVLDACFSGQGRRSLIAKGTRPLVSVVQSKAEPNTVVLAAAGSNQVSASFPEARHGLLTYYLLAGLGGQADANHDGKITAEELIAYVRPAVERAAKLQNVEQTPSLMSSSEAVQQPWIVLAPKK